MDDAWRNIGKIKIISSSIHHLRIIVISIAASIREIAIMDAPRPTLVAF
jgi:hypothetical protein